jgi:microcystin-dependent protein
MPVKLLGTAPTAASASAVGDAATAGTSQNPALADHKHGRESFATPAIVLGTAAAAGAATTPIRSDATILAFDATLPTTSASADAAAAGSAATAARRDHVHGREAIQAPPGTLTMIASGVPPVTANVLSANDAGFEGGIGTWAALTNCSVSQSATQALDGTKSLALSSTASGDMAATTAIGTGGYAVSVDTYYGANFWVRSAVSARAVSGFIRWYNAAGTFLSASGSSFNVTDATTGWSQIWMAGVAPATAAFAAVEAYVTGTGGAAEIHYIDRVVFGAFTLWLPCEGATISRTVYAALWNAIGPAYGQGNGTTTFGLPDMRCKVPVGAGYDAAHTARTTGVGGGAETHALSLAELASHNHSHSHSISWQFNPPDQFCTSGGNNATSGGTSWTGGGATIGTDATAAGSGTAFGIMPPYLTVGYMIRAA